MPILSDPTKRSHRRAWISRSLSVSRPKIFLLGLICLTPAWSDIYTYTDNNGTVYLSDMPTEKHYRVLVTGPIKYPETSPFPELIKASPGIARKLAAKFKYDQLVEQVSRIYGVDSALLHAVISVESRYNPNAVSKRGATGLMQLMPGTAKRYGVVDLLDPAQNLHAGAQYMRDMLLLFNNDMSLAIAAYNAGENAVIRHGNRIPPFPETMDYVPKVLGFYQEYRAARSHHT